MLWSSGCRNPSSWSPISTPAFRRWIRGASNGAVGWTYDAGVPAARSRPRADRLPRTAWDLQRRIHAEVAAGERPDTVILLEHAPVYTAGKRTEPHERPVDGTPVIDVDRGGKITWHGPGQLVGYPIVRLPEAVYVVDYVRRLEEAMIALFTEYGLATGRVPRPLRGLARRPTAGPAGAQDRRHRRPGGGRSHHARLRPQRRPGSPARSTRSSRAAYRSRRHLAGRRARARGGRGYRSGITLAGRVADVCAG